MLAAFHYSNASPVDQIDEQATALAPWKPGEIVAEEPVFFDLVFGGKNLYRTFLGITGQGYFVVQDFYADSQREFSSPFVLMHQESVDNMDLLKYEYTSSNIPDVFDGTVTAWYENGQKMLQVSYHEGQRQGPVAKWHSNGEKWLEGEYQEGKEQGLWIYWHDNGLKYLEIHFQNGLKNGLWTMWFDNGQKLAEGPYKDDEKQGRWIMWNEEGEKVNEMLYEAGEIVSEPLF